MQTEINFWKHFYKNKKIKESYTLEPDHGNNDPYVAHALDDENHTSIQCLASSDIVD